MGKSDPRQCNSISEDLQLGLGLGLGLALALALRLALRFGLLMRLHLCRPLPSHRPRWLNELHRKRDSKALRYVNQIHLPIEGQG